MLQIKAHGLTGPIEFKDSQRTNFTLQLMRLSGGEKGGIVLSGHWNPTEGLAVTDPAAYKRDPPPNVTLTVVTVEVNGFYGLLIFMDCKASTRTIFNDRSKPDF